MTIAGSLPTLIGSGQLGLLLAIYYRLGRVEQRQRDHEETDDRRFTALEKLRFPQGAALETKP
jgi:hypothetical protein